MAEVDFFSMFSCLKTNVLARGGSTKVNQMFSLKDLRMAIIMTVHNEPRGKTPDQEWLAFEEQNNATEKKGNQK